MDNKTLLKSVIDSLVNEDEDAAKASFKQYATTKVRGLVEADGLKKKVAKVEAKQKPDCTDEEKAQEVIDKSNADD